MRGARRPSKTAGATAMRNRRAMSAIVVTTTLMSGGIWSCGLTGRNRDGNIVISGNIEMTQVDIAFKIPGRIVELSVAEGDRVTRGLPLAKLDTEQLEQQRNRDRAGLAAAEAVLPQLATSIEQRRAAHAAEIELRNAEVRQAEIMLEQLLSGSRRQQIEEAKAAAAQARAQFLQAELDWERAQTLYRNDDISTAQRDRFKARLDSTEAALRQADERLALVIEGPRSEEIEAARSRVAQARAALKLTEASRLEIRRLEQELQVRRAEVDRARAQVALIEAQIRDAVALSPVSGVVLVKSA
ncbi:MAG: biotin/lipoyl-binding protein, partial [Acidobacteria bacterium]|nr:biotin/lipoyl-binding protein [Acidobacteriota bacterium]